MAQPERFGRYRVLRRLGSGSFATVWLGHDDLLDTPVAIKVLAENWAHQLDIHHRFVEEARILRHADSEWLVRVHDIGTLPDERPYFVMTYADRGSVADRIAAGTLPMDEALRLLTEIGQGVTVLHRHGTIHRDIKPSNVLLQSSPVGERVLVADLGFAKSIDEASGFTAAAGTPGYMSPEQSVIGGDIDVRADVYSLGAVAYELLTGKRPPRPPVLVPPSRSRPGLPPALDELIMSAMAQNRAERPPDAATFTSRIREIRMAPDLKLAEPWWHRYRAIGARSALAAATALAVLAGASAAAASPGVELVDVYDSTAEIQMLIPLPWAREMQVNGWSPRELGMPGGHEPGLLVATDVAAWGDPEADVSGVFAGLVKQDGDRGLAGLDRLVGSALCPGHPQRLRFGNGRWEGEVWQWQDCPSGGVFTTAALNHRAYDRTLYLEIRQSGHQPTVVDEILAGARLTE
ncbi:serine/threonine-protein kinase [Nocardiopsis ansamitocini]|uniref:non-specific serine/threonine protein kinase n=1 Tax=Nocardiopsis ansamitocini TaxID=1670832 RepID=A0A9W6UHL2_9ACTN|nr:serine/threonine-protein kinase [Nocardiopsis ansamitocini]GLU46847.1 serine/threonine protein kinase [Nocardiopsis ansamitocini]